MAQGITDELAKNQPGVSGSAFINPSAREIGHKAAVRKYLVNQKTRVKTDG